MKQFRAVLQQYRKVGNPEPGVLRAPTLAEQERTLRKMAAQLGGEIVEEILIASQESAINLSSVKVSENPQLSGVLVFSIEALRNSDVLDVKLLYRLVKEIGFVGIFLEDLSFPDEKSVHNYILFMIAMNETRIRDSSMDWSNFVNSL